ncbi:response regulator [Oceanicoccus sp. KOV_DT_Chl]|uniref:hybrid sensor histidine kinase/response regulator n=1 Tax=Oceanicoccus sp. KOV_DT_Chl TaxID=1904639 RepID=UPI000C7AF7FD|nr:response regulator [Oceanicoccus sp. KOV_DT_Chl]
MSQRQQQQQDILLQLSRILVEDPENLDQFWQSLSRLAANHLEADLISVWLVTASPEGDINHCICEYNKPNNCYTDLNKVNYDFKLSCYPLYMTALNAERVLALDDCRSDPRSIELLEQFFIPDNTYSMLDATIRTQSNYIGHISIEHNHHQHHWSENEIAFASALSDQAAIAILENQRALLNLQKSRQLQRIKKQQAAIAELSRRQTTIDGDLDKTATHICHLINQVLDSQIVTVCLTDDNDFFRVVYEIDAREKCEKRINRLPCDYQQKEYQHYFSILEKQEVIVSDDTLNDPQLKEFYTQHVKFNIQASIDAAIRAQGKLIGFVCCEKTQNTYQWHEDEVAFIRNMADIFSQAHMNNALRTAKQEAEQATQQKSIFLANMSHEIRTPMNGILGMAEIAMGTALSSQQATYIENIITSAESLLSLINEILDLSKIESGALEIDIHEFDVRELIADVCTIFNINSNQHINLQVNIDNNVPKRINSDSLRLRQILINLLSNAFKFTDSGAINLQCSIAKDNHIRFSVKDTGIGFDPHKRDLLFKSFTQADTSTAREYGGSGLGLSISKMLCELLGGSISANSKLGDGAEFWFTIVNQKQAERSTKTYRTPLTITPIANFKPDQFHLLVAEDNDVNLLVLTTLLTNMNFSFDTVKNGELAIDAVRRQHYDLVLMDCQMPVMDGFEATQQIRKLPNSKAATKIIALTANAMDSDRDKCLDAGMNDYLCKPYKANDLLTLIQHVLTQP